MADNTAAAVQPAPKILEQFLALHRLFIQIVAVRIAAELDIAEHVASGPLSVEELAAQTNAHAPSLFRLLRALESIGVFKQVSPRVFANTPESEMLRKGVAGSVWASTQAGFVCGFNQAVLGLPDSIRTGRTAFDQVHGCSLWEFQQRDPKRAEIFDHFMRLQQSHSTAPITNACDWSRFPVIADVGGGIGGQLVDILNAHRSCHGILFDQPHVVARAIPHDRIECIAGSFFERVPVGADAYILRSVIHDWDDPQSVAILKTVRAAAKADSRIILIEMIVPETEEYSYSKWNDLYMMALAGGHERTAKEYRRLLQEAGWEVEEVISTPADRNLIVARPRKDGNEGGRELGS